MPPWAKADADSCDLPQTGSVDTASAPSGVAALAAMLEGVPTCLLLLDADLACLFANAAARTLLGDLLSNPGFASLFPADERALLAAASGGWTSIFRLSGNLERAVECVPSHTTVDGRSLVILAIRDVSAARESARKATALARVAASMTYAGSLEATLDALARSVVEATGMEACLFWALEDQRQLRVAGTYGFPDGYVAALEQIARSGVAMASLQALDERRPIIFLNAPSLLLKDRGFAPVHPYLATASWRALACLPLIFHGRPLGTLVAHFQHAPDEAAMAFLSAIADQAAVAVENARLAAAAQAAAALEERKHALVLVEEKDAQYRAIFEATSDGVAITDLDGYVVEANPAICRMHGYTYDEVIGKHTSDFIPSDGRGRFATFARTILENGSFQDRVLNLRKDGTPFPVDVQGSTFLYRGRMHLLTVLRDVTEQVEAYKLLEQRVEERTRELGTVLEVSHDMASTLELQPLLGLILAHLRKVVDYRDANIMLLDGDELSYLDYWGPLSSDHMIGRRVSLAHADANRQVIEGRAPLIIPDIWDDRNPTARSFRRVGKDLLDNTHTHFTAWLGVPLLHKERVIGMLGLSHTVPGYFTERHASLALAIANQAAVAIENARLYARAQQAAALEERARLARELHDSVSQALYGIALGARTARTLLARDASKVGEPLDYVLSLAEAGLTEMRALIFALRPESLATEGLVVALGHQIAALRTRHELQVVATLGAEPDAAYAVKEAVYRIAQEALHNTVKHARARNVRVALEESASGLALAIEDDGVGFDPGGEFPGHLGLRSMRERAEALGGTLALESAPGRGTHLAVWLPRLDERYAG